MVQWNSWRCTGILVLEASPISKRWNLRGPNFPTNFLPFPPNLQDIGCPVVIFPKGCYIWVIYDLHNTTNHPWFRGGVTSGTPIPQTAAGNSSASTEELPSWHRQEGDTPGPTTDSTSSVAPLVAAELRRRIDVVDCTSMDANVNGMRHGDLERVCFFFDTWMFFWGGGGIFFEWWVGEATVLIFFGVIFGLFLTFLLLFSCWSTPEMPWQLRLLRSQYQPCGWFEGALFRIAWTITPPKFNWHSPWRKRWERKMILSL